MTGHLTLARGLAVLCLLVLVGVCVSPFFYGWHVVAAWVFLAVVLAILAVTEDRAAQEHRRKMRMLSVQGLQTRLAIRSSTRAMERLGESCQFATKAWAQAESSGLFEALRDA